MPSLDEIIERIKTHIADPEAETDVELELYPPTTLDRVEAAEKELGFALPPLLKRLYIEVGNGGFGPEYGLAGIDGCGTNKASRDIVTLYRQQEGEEWKQRFPQWPDKMLKIGCLGCGMYAAIDCSTPDYNLFLFEPNAYGLKMTDLEKGDLRFANCLFPYRSSFNEWLYAWAQGENVALPEEFREPEEDYEEDEEE